MNLGVFSCNDEIDYKNQIIIQRIGEHILDGTERWLYDSITKTYYYYQDNKFHNPCGGFFDTMLCTHFNWRQYTKTPPYATIQGGVENEIMFNYDFGVGGVEKFIEWLQKQVNINTPVIIKYILQEPIIRHIEIPNPRPRFIPKHKFIISDDGFEPNYRVHTSVVHSPF